MPSAPWTDIGRIEQDIQDVKSRLRGKVDAHEIHTLSSRVDSLERTCREIRSDVDGIQYRVQELEQVRLTAEEARHDRDEAMRGV